MSGSKPKLYYFTSRGRAELIRLVFVASGNDFEDIRYTKEQWLEHKKDAPTGVMPYLDSCTEHGALVQSGAIARYYAKKFGLMGSTDWEYYQIERAMAQVEDVLQEIIKIFMAPEDKKAEAMKEFQGEKTHRLLTCLVKFLKENGDFYAGKLITIADLCSVTLIDYLQTFGPELLVKFPELVEHRQRVLAANVRVAEWIKSRPETPY